MLTLSSVEQTNFFFYLVKDVHGLAKEKLGLLFG